MDFLRSILVTGATGFVGGALVSELLARGTRVLALSRKPMGIDFIGGKSPEWLTWDQELPEVDGIIHLAGAPIVPHPWTKRRKKILWNSRVRTSEFLIRWIGSLPPRSRPKVLVSASAVGIYGTETGDQMLSEGDLPDPSPEDFLAQLCKAWEGACRSAEPLGLRTVQLRLGTVLNPEGGFLSPILPLLRMKVRFEFGTGAQWMSWIERSDLISLILFVLENPSVSGPINAVSPEPVSHQQFMKTLSTHFGSTLKIKIPDWILKMGMREQSRLLLKGQRVIPKRALDSGFKFSYPDLASVVSSIPI